MDEENLELVRMLLARLERISANSYWAHRASGARGVLLKSLEEYVSRKASDNPNVQQVFENGHKILLASVLKKIKHH